MRPASSVQIIRPGAHQPWRGSLPVETDREILHPAGAAIGRSNIRRWAREVVAAMVRPTRWGSMGCAKTLDSHRPGDCWPGRFGFQWSRPWATPTSFDEVRADSRFAALVAGHLKFSRS